MNKPSAVSSTNVDINSIDTHDTVNPFLPHYTLQKRNNNGKIKERKFTALEVQRFIDQAVQQRETQLREEFSCTLQKLLQGMCIIFYLYIGSLIFIFVII